MRILIVSNSYPPHVSPRSIRWSAIAEQWAARGDDVHVIAGWSPNALREETLSTVSVHRVGGGLSERLRGRLNRERPPTAAKGTQRSSSVVGSGLRRACQRTARFLHDSIWKNIYWPDYACLWSFAAVQKARRLLQERPFDVLLTSSLPFTDHLVGLRIVRKFPGTPWLVDVGDPFSFLQNTPTNNHFLYKRLNRRVEQRVFSRGDSISVTNENTREIYAEMFPDSAERIRVIPPLLRTDVGETCREPIFEENGRIRIVFIGTLHPNVRTPQRVCALFRGLLKTTVGPQLELHFFGPVNHCESFFAEFEPLLGRQLFLHGSVSHTTARQVMVEADVLLNLGNTTTYQLPSKIVEYANTGRPILNVTTMAGDSSAAFLQSSAAAMTVCLPHAGEVDDARIADVAQFISRTKPLDRSIVDDWCRPYRIDSIVQQYDTLLAAAMRHRRGTTSDPEKISHESGNRVAKTVRTADVAATLRTEPQPVSITGATGFIGRRLVELLAQRDDVALRLLSRQEGDGLQAAGSTNVVSVRGDLLDLETLSALPQRGGTVINLAFLAGRSCDDNLKAASHLADVCGRAGIKRLIHCSTAVVAGRTKVNRIDEQTPCSPSNDYESTKLAIEQTLRQQADGQFELVILRPTAVFGQGGKNLVKLANDLRHGSRIVNYLKSCLFDKRRMNAVCLENVVRALQFLLDEERNLDGEIFLISDDDQPGNTYRDIEKGLLSLWGEPDYPLPRIPLPQFALSACLRMAGRPNVHPDCRYDSGKILSAGFRKPVSLEDGLRDFSQRYDAA